MAGAGWRDFVPGEVLTAANVQDYLQDQAVMVFASAAARTSGLASPTKGMVSYLSDINSLNVYDGSAWVFPNKIVQIVRATSTTQRTTTSTTFVDTNESITITPKSSTSSVLLLATFQAVSNRGSQGDSRGAYQWTTSANAAIAGAEGMLTFSDNDLQGFRYMPVTISAYHSPATTSATTYKLRFRVTNANNTAYVNGPDATTTLYAFEIGA